MAFEAILTIEDKEFKVFTFNYYSGRDHDKLGRATSTFYGFKLDMVLEHSPDCVLLHQWAYTNYEVKSGKITFYQRTGKQKQTEIRFEQGYLVNIGTSFDHQGETSMRERIVICAKLFEYESMGRLAVYEMLWAE